MTLFDNLDETPKASPLHLWADWTELLCFTSEDGQISVPELSNKIKEQREDIRLGPDPEQGAVDDPPDPLVAAILLDDAVSETDAQANFENGVRTRADDILKYLVKRAARYLDAYPFEVDSAKRTITLRSTTMTRDLYVYLLFCSLFKYVRVKAREGELAAGFELLAQAAAENYLPADAIVRRFGSNGRFPAPFYNGLLKDTVIQLAKDLGDLTVALRPKDVLSNNRGDGGLDIVAWMPLGDRLPGMPIFFAQCACTPKWQLKQHSSSHATWRKMIHFPDDTANWCFIPFDFRDLENDWFSRIQIQSSVLFDRFRLVHLLAEPQTNYAELRVVGSLDEVRHSAIVDEGRAQELNEL